MLVEVQFDVLLMAQLVIRGEWLGLVCEDRGDLGYLGYVSRLARGGRRCAR